MIRARTLSSCLAAAGMAALAAAPLAADQAEAGESVTAALKTADGTDAGTVIFAQAEHGVVVKASLKNLGEGTHGFHIHETGACAPDFDAAGGHFNPRGKEHGFDTAEGYHAGDLPNIRIGTDGTGDARFLIPKMTLKGPASDRNPHLLGDADGASVMIHAEADDYRSMDSAGARIACGVIIPKGG